MKLNKNFVIHNTGNDYVLIPMGNSDFSGVVKGNKTVGFILNSLQTETTETEIVNQLHYNFSDDNGIIEKDVSKVIEELRKIGAIDE